MTFEHKDFLSTRDLSVEDINLVLDTAKSFAEVSERRIKKVPTLRGKTVINLFFEPSTRTRSSFEIAGKRLSADTVNISGSGSSLTKGETIKDTALNLQAMNPDVIVIRHSCGGVPKMIADAVKASVINAGDGINEHPTQAMLDLLTMKQKRGDLKGINVCIVGDIANSRVAKSNIYALKKLGADVTAVGPKAMIPPGFDELGVRVSYDLDRVIPDADVLMMLRIQLERQTGKGNLFPTLREYSRQYGLNLRRMEKAKESVIVMHPGPLNRGIEISPEVADGPFAVILDQVTNGVAVRMALLYLLASSGESPE